MATKKQITQLIKRRNTNYINNTVKVFETIPHIIKAVCCFVDCQLASITWYNVEINEVGIVIHGLVSESAPDSVMIFEKIGSKRVLVEVPEQFIDGDDPVPFVDYLINKSDQYAQQMDQLKSLLDDTQPSKKQTVH